MSKPSLPVWESTLRTLTPKTTKPLREVDAARQFRPGDLVNVPFGGKRVRGRIVNAPKPAFGATQTYTVNVGSSASEQIPVHNISLATPNDGVAIGGRVITEAEGMTTAQIARREKFVKALKKRQSDLKDRYGSRWKQVMYATATKMAMKESALYEADETPEMTPAQKKRRDEIVKGMKQNAESFKSNYGDDWEDVLYATATAMAMEQPEEYEASLSEAATQDLSPEQVAKELEKLDRPTEGLSASQINKSLDDLDTYHAIVQTHLMVSRFTQNKDEIAALLTLRQAIAMRKAALLHEIGLRLKPVGVYRRLPDDKAYDKRPVTEEAENAFDIDPTGKLGNITYPIRKTAAMTFAGGLVDRPVGSTPEQIVDNALKYWFTQHPSGLTSSRLQSLGSGLDLMTKMGIQWDLSLVPVKFIPHMRMAHVKATLAKTV